MIKISGLKELEKKLDKLSQNAQKLDGQHAVPVTEILTSSFLSKHTRFVSADALFEESDFKIESVEDFKAIPEAEWDAYVRSVSNFTDWKSMLSEATKEWVSKKLAS